MSSLSYHQRMIYHVDDIEHVLVEQILLVYHRQVICMAGIVFITHKHLYLLLNSLYISGIILVGTQVLLSATWQQAFLFAAGTLFVYLLGLRGAIILVKTFARSDQSALKSYKQWIVVAGVTTVIVSVYGVLVNLLCKAEIGPPKYYFYGIALARNSIRHDCESRSVTASKLDQRQEGFGKGLHFHP